MASTDTKSQLMDAAQKLCQTRGYNGFSFHDLAKIVGIRTASIHYHFPTKADLGKALIVNYRQRMEMALAEIERRESTLSGRLKRVAGLLRANLRDGDRMCLCGMLAAEVDSISPEMRKELQRLFDEVEGWLARCLEEARKSGNASFSGSPASAARAIFGAMEGAMMSARAFGDEERLTDSARWIATQLAEA